MGAPGEPGVVTPQLIESLNKGVVGGAFLVA
jgi:hypothetical protein